MATKDELDAAVAAAAQALADLTAKIQAEAAPAGPADIDFAAEVDQLNAATAAAQAALAAPPPEPE